MHTRPSLLNIAIKYVLYKWCSRKRQSWHASCNKSAFNVMIYPRYLDRHLIAASCAGGQRWMLNVTSGLLSASLSLMGLGNFFLFQVSVIFISIPLLLLPTSPSVFFFLSTVIDHKEDNMSYLVEQRTEGVSFHLKNH